MLERIQYLSDFWNTHKSAQKVKELHLKSDFGGVLIVHGNIKLNEMNLLSLTLIFAFSYRIISGI